MYGRCDVLCAQGTCSEYATAEGLCYFHSKIATGLYGPAEKLRRVKL